MVGVCVSCDPFGLVHLSYSAFRFLWFTYSGSPAACLWDGYSPQSCVRYCSSLLNRRGQLGFAVPASVDKKNTCIEHGWALEALGRTDGGRIRNGIESRNNGVMAPTF